MSIIEEILHSEIYEEEAKIATDIKLREKINKIYRELHDSLSPELKSILMQYDQASFEEIANEQDKFFVLGFKAGIKLMVEVLS